MELINEGSYQFFKVDSEEYRVYEFISSVGRVEEKVSVRINSPEYVSVNPNNGGHRILDAEGISHYVPIGWKHLYWKAKPGKPHFVK